MRQIISGVVVVLCLIAGVVPANGQNISGGVKGGVSFATIPDFVEATEDPTVNTGVRTGLVIGGFVSFSLAERVSLQPEVLYAQKGLSISDASGGPVGGEASIELDYVDIPVLLVYRFAPSGRNSGYVFGGPSFGFNTRARVTGAGMMADEDEDIDEEVKDREFGLVFGGGAVFGPFLVEARWTEGLSAVNEDTDLVKDLRNRSGAILVGVRF
jgi:hypothetical protein